MPRNLDPTLAASLSNGSVSPIYLVDLTFKTRNAFVWTGVGNLQWNGLTYSGTGSLGQIGGIKEGIEVKADGTTLTLSGIDPILYSESLEDIQVGLPVVIRYGHVIPGTLTLIGTPYIIYLGTMDVPTFQIDGDTLEITLALESLMLNHARATVRRYTSADQRLYYPDDTGFFQVEVLNDLALNWGN